MRVDLALWKTGSLHCTVLVDRLIPLCLITSGCSPVTILVLRERCSEMYMFPRLDP